MRQTIQKRINRVLNDLQPNSELEGEDSTPQNIQRRLEKYSTPATSIAVVNNWELEWARTIGQCEAGEIDKATTETYFQAGSISKSVFSLATMRLVENGLVSLDEDVNVYLNTLEFPLKGRGKTRVTLRHLLSHTGGLTVHGFPGYSVFEPVPTSTQILSGSGPANTEEIRVSTIPGLQFRYSGGGFVVAQMLLEKLLGISFSEIMRDLVLDPLGLVNSTFEQKRTNEWRTVVARGHSFGGIPIEGGFRIYPEMAAAGLWTNARDLAKIGIEIIKTLAGEKHTLVTKKSLENMFCPQLPLGENATSNFYGLGFQCEERRNTFYFGHRGSNYGYMASMWFSKDTGKGVVVLINSNEGAPLLEEISSAVEREYD